MITGDFPKIGNHTAVERILKHHGARVSWGVLNKRWGVGPYASYLLKGDNPCSDMVRSARKKECTQVTWDELVSIINGIGTKGSPDKAT